MPRPGSAGSDQLGFPGDLGDRGMGIPARFRNKPLWGRLVIDHADQGLLAVEARRCMGVDVKQAPDPVFIGTSLMKTQEDAAAVVLIGGGERWLEGGLDATGIEGLEVGDEVAEAVGMAERSL